MTPSRRLPPVVLASLLVFGGGAPSLHAQDVTAYTGATLWDGTGAAPVQGATLVVRDGRILAAGAVAVPAGARVEDLSGKWVTPGLVDTHAHVTGRWPGGRGGPSGGAEGDLRLFALYGITTVNSLGDEPESAFPLREEKSARTTGRARLQMAGPVISSRTAEEARAAVAANVAMGVDWLKIRVDDNLGSTTKVAEPAVRAVLEEARARGYRVASHLFYLEDAKALLRGGTGMVAHSIRDVDVDDEVVRLLRERGVCYVPTLVREVSTFTYADGPAFLEDPFFLEHADPAEVERVSRADFVEQTRQSRSAALYREALVQAQKNLKRLVDAGVTVAFGTDAGPPARFPGYFEHMELSLMVEAGLTPEQALRSATGVAARCIGMEEVGTLEAGKWADFLVLGADPLQRVENTRALERVYVSGERVR